MKLFILIYGFGLKLGNFADIAYGSGPRFAVGEHLDPSMALGSADLPASAFLKTCLGFKP
jgi:hypothetical protein